MFYPGRGLGQSTGSPARRAAGQGERGAALLPGSVQGLDLSLLRSLPVLFQLRVSLGPLRPRANYSDFLKGSFLRTSCTHQEGSRVICLENCAAVCPPEQVSATSLCTQITKGYVQKHSGPAGRRRGLRTYLLASSNCWSRRTLGNQGGDSPVVKDEGQFSLLRPNAT